MNIGGVVSIRTRVDIAIAVQDSPKTSLEYLVKPVKGAQEGGN